MTNPDEHALDDMLAELRQTSAEDQYMAALDTMARRVAHYYLALLANGVGYMLAELRQTSAEDQYMAAIDTMARRVAHYYLALIGNGAGYAATVLTLDYQRAQLGLHP